MTTWDSFSCLSLHIIIQASSFPSPPTCRPQARKLLLVVLTAATALLFFSLGLMVQGGGPAIPDILHPISRKALWRGHSTSCDPLLGKDDLLEAQHRLRALPRLTPRLCGRVAQLDLDASRWSSNGLVVDTIMQSPPPRCHDPNNTILVCVLVRNQADKITEFIGQHWVQGVTHFAIYDDHSEDNLREVLRPWMDAGIVSLEKPALVHPRDSPNPLPGTTASGHTESFEHCFHHYAPRFKWVGFLDGDEIVHPLIPECFPRILARYGQYGGLYVTWSLYDQPFVASIPSTSPEDFMTSLEVVEYTDGRPAALGKSFCQVEAIIGPAYHMPHCCEYKEGKEVGGRREPSMGGAVRCRHLRQWSISTGGG